MVIFKATHRFELTIEEHYGAWWAALREFIPGRLYPIQHLLRLFATRQAAIEALIRKWHVLFPDEAPLVWRDPPRIETPSRAAMHRRQIHKGRSHP